METILDIYDTHLWNIDIFNSLLFVNRKLYKICKDYLDIFINIQLSLFSNRLHDNLQTKIILIKRNLENISGHSVWELVCKKYDIGPGQNGNSFPRIKRCSELKCLPGCHDKKLNLYESFVVPYKLNSLSDPTLFQYWFPILIFSIPHDLKIIDRIFLSDHIKLKREYYWIIRSYSIVKTKEYSDNFNYIDKKYIFDRQLNDCKLLCKVFSKLLEIISYDISTDLGILKQEVIDINNNKMFFLNDDKIISIFATKEAIPRLSIFTKNNRIIHFLGQGVLNAYVLTACMNMLSRMIKTNIITPYILLTGLDSGFLFLPEESSKYNSFYPSLDIDTIATHLIVHYILGIDNTCIMVNLEGIIPLDYQNLYSRKKDILYIGKSVV